MSEVNCKENNKKVFTKLKKEAKVPPMSSALIASSFSKKGKYTKSKRYFILFEDSIYYFKDDNNQVPKGYVQFNFGLRFEVLRDKSTDKDKGSPGKKKIGKPRGICLDMDGAYCEIYSSDEETITKWRDLLRNRINQRGFHELFRAQKKIGKGNFASVYLAERLEDEKMFAVKAFSKEAAFSQEKGKEALITEIELMRALDNENIMKLHEVFETENSLYFILDLLEGGQLYDKIKLKHKFSQDEIRTIMGGLLRGIAHMHQRGIMHRDLKPENILFRKQGSFECVIADLGLGTKFDLTEYLFVRCGTPGFVAPEVVNIKDMKTTYGPVCDIFSLGLIFHILLVGKPPFNGKTYNEVLAQNRAGIVKLDGPEFLRVPTDAYDLLRRMVVKDPQNRISSQDAVKHKYFHPNPKKEETKEQKPEEYVSDQFDEDDFMQKNYSAQHKQMQKVKQQILQQSPAMQSPALMPRKLGQVQLDQDSCVAFKMNGSPIMTGNIDRIEDKGGAPGSVFVMNNVETPLQFKRQLGVSPQVGKSTLSQMGKNNPEKNKQIRNLLMNMEPENNNDLQSIQENDEPQSPKDKQEVKKNQQVKNKLQGMI